MEHEERRRRVWGRTILLSAALLVVLPGLAGGVAVLVEYFTRSWTIRLADDWETEFRVGFREDGVLEARQYTEHPQWGPTESFWIAEGTSDLEAAKLKGIFDESWIEQMAPEEVAELNRPRDTAWVFAELDPLPNGQPVYYIWRTVVFESRFSGDERRVVAGIVATPCLVEIAEIINESESVLGRESVSATEIKSLVNYQFNAARRAMCIAYTQAEAERFVKDGSYEILGVVDEIRVDHKPPMTFRFVRVPVLASLGPAFIPMMLSSDARVAVADAVAAWRVSLVPVSSVGVSVFGVRDAVPKCCFVICRSWRNALSHDYNQRSLDLHRDHRGKLEVRSKVPLGSREDLSLAYTPGVAEPCRVIAEDVGRAYDLTPKGNSVAIVSDGSAVLGLGNIGAEASIPVMEGKALLFKAFAGLDAWPICLATQEASEIIETVRRIAPVFGGINLEDIAAPRCFEVEDALQDLGIPVFHDDQHGTAIVTLAGLMNAVEITGRKLEDCRVVISGAGAAGTAIAQMLRCVNFDPAVCVPVKDIVVCDSKGAIHKGRSDLNPQKEKLLGYTNKDDRSGSVHEVLEGADIFIGVSKAGLLDGDDIRRMADDAILFAMANPDPEIDPELAREAGAAVVGTGRSDYPNQVNNVLAFPGIFRGAIDARADRITGKMKLAAARALAACVGEASADRVLPEPMEKGVAEKVAEAVKGAVE